MRIAESKYCLAENDEIVDNLQTIFDWHPAQLEHSSLVVQLEIILKEQGCHFEYHFHGFHICNWWKVKMKIRF